MTIKIKSTDERTQGAFVVINLRDFDSTKHEPFDEDARAALAGAVASGEIIPSAAELLAARDQLEKRAEAEANSVAAQLAELNQMRADLDAKAAQLQEQGAAQEAESVRLRDEAAKQAKAAKAAKSE